MLENILTPELLKLRAAFQRRGHDLWIVGGCVRDILMGVPFKDVDFATDATPGEQREIYLEESITPIPTGLQHGTWTIVLDEITYEITTFRIENAHDGRYAEMTWTRNLHDDLSRRDITVNAMAMTFEGEVIDPFNGRADLAQMKVRFVGVAADRMREDYLRILRFFRFHGRIAGYSPLDDEAYRAVIDAAPGLIKISRERIWAEMAKILVGPAGASLFMAMIDADIGPYIDLPEKPIGTWIEITVATNVAHDPVAALVAYLGYDVEAVRQLASKWHFSAEERDRGVYLAQHSLTASPNGWPVDQHGDMIHESYIDAAKYMVAVNEHRKDWLVGAFRMNNMPMAALDLEHWVAPEFPIQGRDLLAAGMQPGPNVGSTLKMLREQWGRNGYHIDKEAVLAEVK